VTSEIQVTKRSVPQQVQFLNYISEKRLTTSASIGAETVLVVCATLRAKHPDIFGPLKFSDGALEAYVQACRTAVFDAGDASASVAFPHVLCEFERAVAAPFVVLQVRRGAVRAVALRDTIIMGFILAIIFVLCVSTHFVVNLTCDCDILPLPPIGISCMVQGSLSAEMGREKFPVEIKTFQTFGLHALLQRVYALTIQSRSRSICSERLCFVAGMYQTAG
jgi:hypothetical protein